MNMTMAAALDEDTIDDILYWARVNEMQELFEVVQASAAKQNVGQAAILSQAIDAQSRNTALHYSCGNAHLGTGKGEIC